MPEEVDTYCTVFVHGAEDPHDLARAVGDILGGAADQWCTVAVDSVEVTARDSDWYSDIQPTDYPIGFYSFPHLLEVEFAEGTTVDTAIGTVSRVLRGLWDRGWAAVAASGYADRLPHDGGVSEHLPWPGRN